MVARLCKALCALHKHRSILHSRLTSIVSMSSKTGPDDTRKPFVDKYFECAENGNTEELSFLLNGTVNVDQKNDKGWTALMFAARHGQTDIIKKLLEKGCDTNIVNKTGQTAQDIALFWDQDMAARLIESHTKEENPDQQLRNFFSLNLLDRASEKRKDKDWIQSKLNDETSQFLLLSDLKPFVVPIKDKSSKWRYRLSWVDHIQISSHLASDPVIIFLGVDRSSSQALFAVDVSGMDESKFTALQSESSFLVPFPGSLQMEPSDAGIFAEARSMMDWLDRYKFCATCGSQTDITEGGHKRVCRNKDCKSNKGVHNTAYPRTDPSVIMLVISADGKRCLLGRKKQFPPKMWSCLAGFMEPGETIEDTVRREVEEESGVKVGRVDYHSSQPWPFPASLMLGTIAYAKTEDIKIDEDEMEDARWFRRPEVVQMLTHQQPHGLYVPPEQAIAHQIIKSWVRNTANSNL
ncbi:NAD-capped RNA hydrolase NUDT12-like isoform X2 [Saccostrea echinata]|uniref:NAD-capped RNA hydrolase NUDT12-like isoform X2 n=1 Tax=Saccostrea echinata TaxID=191078 RepID=UPI002A7F5EDE|nr:NAD-capped RNA hydrolase NUDT12-like isoform X2 [Saccostrea echinata]